MVEGRTHKPVVTRGVCEVCNVCVHGCPAEMIPEFRREMDSLRGALYSGEKVKPARTGKKTGLPPCQEACPVDLKTSEYVHLIGEGKFLEALDLIREELPFPGVIGRICHHPCQYACLREEAVDEAVSLCDLKRFVADYEVGRREMPAPAVGKDKGKKVAIIGGGPSGMTCALELRKAGYHVTIFEAGSALGGMLLWGVPAFRLPRDVLEREVRLVEKAGVDVRYNTRVGRDVSLREIQESFKAVYVGCGAEEGARLGIENEDAAGVWTGVEFLRIVNESGDAAVGGKVIVVGGGNVAVDTALTARRLGVKEVRMVCLEKPKEMQANKEEIEQAREEGVKIVNGWGPKRIVVNGGQVTGVEFKKCKAAFDKEGRFNPVYSEEATKVFDADTVIVAVGQSPAIDFLKGIEGLEMAAGGWIKADIETLETSVPGIFAGGDIVTGPGMAINAIADGKRAAAGIGEYLEGAESIAQRA
jgi:NADPH-dependent glutamate synthase beta subunit-like oxidoreductase